jgi:hypothetical protein
MDGGSAGVVGNIRRPSAMDGGTTGDAGAIASAVKLSERDVVKVLGRIADKDVRLTVITRP